MKDNRESICEYSEEESALIGGAPLSDACHTDGIPMLLELRSREYALLDFTMFSDSVPEGIPPEAAEEFESELLSELFTGQAGEPASEEYTLRCNATLAKEGELSVLIYDECIDGESTQTTRVLFDKSLPGLVTVCREGALSVTMTVEMGRRHSCVYRTPFMDFDMRLRGVRVENTLTDEGGHILLDYALEIRGAVAHRTVMEISLTKAC